MRRVNKFTLLELLVVIAILAIIAALLMPMFVRVRTKGRMANDISNLKQVYLALINYSMDNDSYLPHIKDIETGDHQAKNLWLLLPYIGYNTRVLTPSIDQMNGHLIYQTMTSDPESAPVPEFAYAPLYQADEADSPVVLNFKLPLSSIPIVSTYNQKYDTWIILKFSGEVDFSN